MIKLNRLSPEEIQVLQVGGGLQDKEVIVLSDIEEEKKWIEADVASDASLSFGLLR